MNPFLVDANVKITGDSLSNTQFRVHETISVVDPECVLAVLRGELAAYRIRKFLPDSACRQIVENFWNSPDRVTRPGYGEDGVEGYFLGASHIERTTLDYLEAAHKFEAAVRDLYTNSINPADAFRDAFATRNSANIKVRAAQFNGMQAGNSKAVYWNSMGEFLLLPHEDLSQLSDPRQNNFEIKDIPKVGAFNFYAEVPPNAGQLKIWNIEPDARAKAALNVTYSGYPYPPEALEDIPSIVIPVATGDVCFIYGNLIHGALRGDQQASAKERMLVTFFSGLNERNELLWWT